MTQKSVVVLDYGSGNLRSVQRALQRAGAEVTISADPDAIDRADGLVVPGVGAFDACMKGLHKVNGAQLITNRLTKHRPTLGICVGMQILFTYGEEFGITTPGIGLWPGRITQLQAPVIPHMGWNTVQANPTSTLFSGLDSHTRFYFVHSYAAQRWEGPETTVLTWANYHTRFLAAIEDGPLMATQFHPEKSGDAGAHLLTNWMETL